MQQRFVGPGLFIMDEPESALSFHGQLRLMALMTDAVADGSQFVIATHSPLLMHFPGARLLSFDGGTIQEAAYDDLEVVVLWRRFMEAPDVFLSALLERVGPTGVARSVCVTRPPHPPPPHPTRSAPRRAAKIVGVR